MLCFELIHTVSNLELNQTTKLLPEKISIGTQKMLENSNFFQLDRFPQ